MAKGFLRFTRSLALRRLFREWCVGEAKLWGRYVIGATPPSGVDRSSGFNDLSLRKLGFWNLGWVRGVECAQLVWYVLDLFEIGI